MTRPLRAVREFRLFRFWLTVTSCIVSALFVPSAQADSRKLPLFFVENRGQFPGTVRFVAKGAQLSGYFSPADVVMAAGPSRFRVTFPGADPRAALEGTQLLAARVNYMVGARGQWKADVPAYAGVAYRGIFPGIDLIYSSSGSSLKADFTVAPGADPSAIRLQYEAAEPVLEMGGGLSVRGSEGEFREAPPVVYQEVDGRRNLVSGAFLKRRDGTVGFQVGPYDRTKPLIIDPVISYSTYLGGGSMDAITAVAVDGVGNAYVAGWTVSSDLPVVNPVKATISGSVDAFVVKLGPGGNSLIYCTYLGGRGDDRAFGIAVDPAGNAYVTGWTGSSAFPTVAPAQAVLGGSRDAFVAKLNPLGNALVYSTYLGGAANDSGNAIAVDAGGNAYIGGGSYSSNFPTLGAYQSAIHGPQNAFVAKFNPSGTLLYSTYLGGNGNDSAAGIAVDTSGNVYVTGGTTSSNFPVVAAIQPASGGNQDVFVTKLNSSGNALIYSTYLGGSSGTVGANESGTAIAVDVNGAAYVTGVTSSTNFPVTAGAVQSTYLGGGDDAFVAKLNPAGTALVYSTYLGGGSVDFATGIAVDFVGSAYVTGYTASSDFISLRGLQPGNAGSYDAFLTKLNPAGNAVIFSTYFGGTASDAAYAVAVDPLCNAYVAGLTQSSDLPTSNAFQALNAGGYGGFLSKLSPGWKAAVFLSGTWYVDNNRNGGYDGPSAGDQILTFGQSGDIPVVGDWSGSGTLKIGVFRNGQWLLDYNGNGVWDGAAGGDRLYTFGQSGDIPVVGDWNGTGTAKIGVFRGGFWMLDVNGNGTFDGTAGSDNGFWFGNSSYNPVVGDWTGSGTTKAGLFINGTWYIDTNGDGLWVAGTDQSFNFGQAGDIPITGDWTGSGKSNLGVFRSGFWIVDMNANGSIDGIGIGEAGFWLGNSSFTPVVMR